MKLVGMLDSPYVRRVAISLQLLGLEFEHEPLSVFRTFDAFSRVNPVVKAPTLVCDSGVVLMDSTLILQHAESIAAPRSLLPRAPAALERDLRVTALALAACEKSVQIVYELELRPAHAQYAPWLERIRAQLLAACNELDRELASLPIPSEESELTQGLVSAAVAWSFIQEMTPSDAPAAAVVARLAESAGRFPSFQRAPHGSGRMREPAQ